jgi:hypothetical protein
VLRNLAIAPASQSSGGLPLDIVGASPTGAYSLRLLRSAYAGNAIQVRRSSDNTTQNIGFVSGALDTTTLLSFVGAGNGFITIWYDQSGNGNDLTQATVGSQPQIANAGALYTINGLPYFYVNGPQNVRNSTISIFESGASTANLVIVYESSTNFPPIIGATTSGNFCYGINSGPLGVFRLSSASTSFSYTPTVGSSTVLSFLTAGISGGSVTASLYANGTSEGSASVSGYGGQSAGAAVGNFTLASDALTSYFGEATMFASQLSSTDRSALESNQASYYSGASERVVSSLTPVIAQSLARSSCF